MFVLLRSSWNYGDYSVKTCLNSSIETATIARRKARRSLSSGVTLRRPSPEMIFPTAWVPGMRIGTETGKKRNDSSRVFPSEYITMAETMDPTRARSRTPITNTAKRLGRREIPMFRKSAAERRVATVTVKRTTAP